MKNRAFVKYKKTGEIVAGSLVITQGGYPKGGPYKEITMDLCCDVNPCTPTDYSPWTLVTGGEAGDGVVLNDDSGNTNRFTFIGPNDDAGDGWVYLTQYFATETCLQIGYSWTSFDDDNPEDPPEYDRPVYWTSTIEPTGIPGDTGSQVGSTPADGMWNIIIPAGQWFSVGIYSDDSCCGRGFLRVRIYEVPCPTTTTTTTAAPNFDVTADWTLTTPNVVDETSFRTFLESGNDGDGNPNSFTDVVISDFTFTDLGNGYQRITCNLDATGNDFGLAFIDVIDVQGVGNIPNLTNLYLYGNLLTQFDISLPNSLRYLGLGSNQIVTFNPSIALPSSLQYLDLPGNQIVTFNPTVALPNSLNYLWLYDNQMTTAGYTASEPWANAMSFIAGRGYVDFTNNINSASGTTLETILISKGWSVVP